MTVYLRTSPCRKCGDQDATSKWVTWRTAAPSGEAIHHEVIERKCRNCGYAWAERCLDAADTKP